MSDHETVPISSTARPSVTVSSISRTAVSLGSDVCNISTELPLFPCTLEDTTNIAVPVGRTLASYPEVRVYGSRGYITKLGADTQWKTSRKLWKQCRSVVYCDGPEQEGVTTALLERFTYRWKFLYEDGLFFYGRVDDELLQISSVLFPAPYTCDNFSIAFDQNARPVFALENAGSCEIRRLESGSLTVVAFDGTSPVLFQNGTLQPDNTIRDVVCYYLRNGSLCGRWQRDEFGIEHVLIEDVGLTALRGVRAYQDRARPFEYLFGLNECSTQFLVSEIYPFWPVLIEDSFEAYTKPTDGLYRATLLLIDHEDTCEFSTQPAGGVYFSTLVFANFEDATDAFAEPAGGAYSLTLIVAPTQEDSAGFATGPVSGSYALTLIDAGTYTDSSNSYTIPAGGSYG